jgi:hypothetical protein
MRRRNDRGALMIVAVLGTVVLISGMMAFNLLLRKHREHTVRSTVDTKSQFEAESLNEIAQRQLLDGGGAGSTWTPTAPPLNVLVSGRAPSVSDPNPDSVAYDTSDVGY